MEMSQSQEWVGKATKKQTAAPNQTAPTIPMEILDTFWVPRYINQFTKGQVHN